MARSYQYDASGYYAGESEDYGLLPNNATQTAPEQQKGYIPKWTGGTWVQIENHKGEQGYLNGQPHTITDYGPLPDGWSTEAPEPSEAEHIAERIKHIKAELQSIDVAKVRPMSVILEGTATEEEIRRLAELNVASNTLRSELHSLEQAHTESASTSAADRGE